jgi:hypothetical protein
MATHHLPSIVTKIFAFLLHVTMHIQWNQRMNLYLLNFSFIQYLLLFVTNIAYDLSKTINEILVANVDLTKI